jgi:transposase
VAAAVRENRLKQWRSVATRYKKQVANYQAVLVVATRTVLVTS